MIFPSLPPFPAGQAVKADGTSRPLVALLALLRPLFPGDMAVDAEAMHGIIPVFAVVTHGASFFAIRVIVLVMAVDAGEPLFLMHLMGHAHRAHLALQYIPVFWKSGDFCDRDNVGLRLADCPWIKGAGCGNDAGNNRYNDGKRISDIHRYPPLYQFYQ